MANNTVSGKLIDFYVRDQGTSTWKKIVCTENTSFTIKSTLSKKRTNCGIKGSISDPDFSATGGAIQNASPSNAEASYQYIKQRMLSSARMEFKYENAAGDGIANQSGIYNYGDGYFTELGAAGSAEDGACLTFSWSFEGLGILDSNESPA